MSPRNADRINAACFALRSFQWAKGDVPDDDECPVIDLLADLRHCCEHRGFDFDELNGIARSHYLVEY